MPRFVFACLVSCLLLSDLAVSQDLAADFGDLKFRFVGPSRGGRVTTVTGHRAQPRTFYMGATGGGVWKTTDAGANWNNLSDGFFETGSIGSIDVADSDPNIVYVGTGSDGIRSNVIIGRGLYKSTDAGKTWEIKGLRNTGQIGSVVVHPTNPEVVYAAALGSPFGDNPERGVYKTTDGGATWKHILFVSAKTGAVDIELSPDNSNIVYAALWRAERKPWTIISGDDGKENGIYVSRDGGNTWAKKTAGLPNDLIGKVDFAVSAADPSRVYALVETDPKREGLYRSNDYGETWSLVNNFRPLMDRPFYYTNVDVDPTNADLIYVNSTGFYISADAGKNWKSASTPHGDNHDIWINPDDPRIWIQSNDGGANVTLDSGETWSTQENQPTAELYQVNVDDRFPYWLYAGQQDNSTIAVPSNSTGNKVLGNLANWEATGGCETGPAVPKPGDADIVYANCKGMFDVFNRRTGQSQQYYVGAANMYGRNPAELTYRFQRTVPIEVSPHNPNVVYHGSQFVHKTSNNGLLWETISPDLTAFRKERQVVSGGPITRDITGEEHYSVLYTIEESPVQQGVIWTGANDGPVQVTRDGGKTWTNVTPKGLPPEGRIQHIDPSPFDAGTAYVAAFRYLLNDFEPYVFKTSDFGATWTRLTDGKNGIAIDTPVRVVREDPTRKGLLYAGTEYGFYVSFNDGGAWQRFDAGLPATPITDIKVVQGDVVLSTMGRGFWIMDDVSPLRQFADATTNQFFDPRDTFRITSFSRRRSAADADYAPSGVKLNYFLASSSKSDVVISIIQNGTVLRQFKNEPAREGTQPGQGMREPQGRTTGSTGLGSDKGLHRFVWDLRVDGPKNAKGEVTRGPVALPGTYTARLSVGDWSAEQTVELNIDPLMAAEGLTFDDLEAQYDFAFELAQLSLDASALAERAKELVKNAPKDAKIVEEGLKDSRRRMPDVSADPVAELKYVISQLETDNSDSYPPPMLLSQLGYLGGMATGSDQRPGNDAFVRLAELKRQYLELSDRAALAEEALSKAPVQNK
ncbi:MAG: hypothetical protein O3B41_10150 [Bacteroidetes bacterium]|nr:hypothetical protein [Bacteroidota bacterium]